MSETVQEEAPPVGFVDVKTSPVTVTATQRFVLGHDSLEISLGTPYFGTGCTAVTAQERAWGEAAEAEPGNAVERNKLSVVLWEAARAIVISIGMAVIVMVILGVLQSNAARWSSESLQNVVAPHLKPQGIAARQYAGVHSKTRICALIDFRPVGDIPQNAWCIL